VSLVLYGPNYFFEALAIPLCLKSLLTSLAEGSCDIMREMVELGLELITADRRSINNHYAGNKPCTAFHIRRTDLVNETPFHVHSFTSITRPPSTVVDQERRLGTSWEQWTAVSLSLLSILHVLFRVQVPATVKWISGLHWSAYIGMVACFTVHTIIYIYTYTSATCCTQFSITWSLQTALCFTHTMWCNRASWNA